MLWGEKDNNPLYLLSPHKSLPYQLVLFVLSLEILQTKSQMASHVAIYQLIHLLFLIRDNFGESKSANEVSDFKLPCTGQDGTHL